MNKHIHQFQNAAFEFQMWRRSAELLYDVSHFPGGEIKVGGKLGGGGPSLGPPTLPPPFVELE